MRGPSLSLILLFSPLNTKIDSSFRITRKLADATETHESVHKHKLLGRLFLVVAVVGLLAGVQFVFGASSPMRVSAQASVLSQVSFLCPWNKLVTSSLIPVALRRVDANQFGTNSFSSNYSTSTTSSPASSSSSSCSKVGPRRAHRGLFGGKRVQFGNKVSEDGGNKTRRKWKPNVVKKHLFSQALGTSLKVKVTTSVLRSINKFGGLDEYLLKTTDKKLASQLALELKQRVKQALKAQKQLDGMNMKKDREEEEEEEEEEQAAGQDK